MSGRTIAKVVLINIKSHLNTTIHLDPHFNVIAGETDEGKSTVFWLLNWVLFNKPFGWNPKPWKHLKAKGDSRGEVHFTDGNVIVRVRNSTENYYELNGEKLSPKGGVPDKISALVNMNDSNIQPQKDMFFLLNDTAGQVAREISKVANLEDMDKAIKESLARVKVANKEIKDIGKDIKEKNTECEALQWLDKATPALSKLNSQQSEIGERLEKIDRVTTSLSKCQSWKDELAELVSESCKADASDISSRLSAVISERETLDRVENKLSSVIAIKKELDSLQDFRAVKLILSGIVERLKSCMERNSVLSAVSDKLRRIKEIRSELSSGIPVDITIDMNDIRERITSVISARKRLQNILGKVAAVKSLREEIEEVEKKITKQKKGKEYLLSSMEVCPLCSSILN